MIKILATQLHDSKTTHDALKRAESIFPRLCPKPLKLYNIVLFILTPKKHVAFCIIRSKANSCRQRLKRADILLGCNGKQKKKKKKQKSTYYSRRLSFGEVSCSIYNGLEKIDSMWRRIPGREGRAFVANDLPVTRIRPKL